jgi:hypothetical protein
VTKARQGCLLSQYIFNLCEDAIKIRLMEIKVAGLTLDNLRYADDITLVAGSVSELRKLMLALEKNMCFL